MDAEQMGARVYATMYPSGGAEEAAARRRGQRAGEFQAREIGSFSSAWARVLALELPGVQMAAMYQRAIKEAEATERKRMTVKRSRGAVWLYWLGKHMTDMAGPAWKRRKKRHEKGRKK